VTDGNSALAFDGCADGESDQQGGVVVAGARCVPFLVYGAKHADRRLFGSGLERHARSHSPPLTLIVIVGAAMVFSSVSVVANAPRPRRFGSGDRSAA